MCMPNIMEKQLFLFECFPKYIVVAKFLIFNILTNRTILIHYQFVWESFISTWTINFEPGSIWIKLVFEEINLLNFFLTVILDLHNFTMTGVDLYLSKLWLILITILSLLALLMINTCWWTLQLLKMNWSWLLIFHKVQLQFIFRSSASIHLQEL